MGLSGQSGNGMNVVRAIKSLQICRPAGGVRTATPPPTPVQRTAIAPEALFLVEPWKTAGVRFGSRRCGLPLSLSGRVRCACWREESSMSVRD